MWNQVLVKKESIMNWIHYLAFFWIACAVIIISVRYFNFRKRKDAEKTTLKQWLVILLGAPFIILFLPFIPVGDFINKLYLKWKEKKEEEMENNLKASLGLSPDEDYLCFSKMGGAGVIKCGDCGYQERIISFVHGMMSCDIGRQCPNCHTFAVEHNESQEYHKFGDSEQDFICPKCGSVIRKKEESILKGNDKPLFCPNCHSARLYYHMSYIT